jgi:chemotaxis family two-component system response regulator Rcp1
MSEGSLILLAEDNVPDVFLVRIALEEAGLNFRLRVLADGEEVLRYLADVEREGSACPDLLLLDLNMPKIGGQAVLTELRRNARCSSAPVIVITSSDSARDKELVASLGVAHFFRKPADLDEFMKIGTIVREVLQKPSGLV